MMIWFTIDKQNLNKFNRNNIPTFKLRFRSISLMEYYTMYLKS
jgi:hypothetical protein